MTLFAGVIFVPYLTKCLFYSLLISSGLNASSQIKAETNNWVSCVARN